MGVIAGLCVEVAVHFASHKARGGSGFSCPGQVQRNRFRVVRVCRSSRAARGHIQQDIQPNNQTRKAAAVRSLNAFTLARNVHGL